MLCFYFHCFAFLQRMMTMPPNMPYPTATLPHPRTWAPQIPSYPNSMQSLEQNVPMYYPVSWSLNLEYPSNLKLCVIVYNTQSLKLEKKSNSQFFDNN